MNNPTAYAQSNQNQKLDAKRFFGHFGDFLRREFGDEDLSLLDIGTGCGSVLSDVIISRSHLNFRKVIGVDKCVDMVDYCRQQFSSDMMDFEVMDVEKDIPDVWRHEKFDLITSFYCLHWVRDLDKALKNIRSLLKPGGIFCCIFLLDHDIVTSWKYMEEKHFKVMKDWRKGFTWIWDCEDPEVEIRKLLEESGFEKVQIVDDWERGHDFKDIDGVTGHFASVDPFSKDLTDESRQKYINDFQEVFLKIRQFDDFVVSGRVLHIIGRNPSIPKTALHSV